jgi:hypothetical protein
LKTSNYCAVLVFHILWNRDQARELNNHESYALLSGLPKDARCKRILVMLQGYTDDSGSDGNRPPFVLAAYLSEAEKWATFSDEWKAELRREPKIEYFRMAEAATGEGQFFGVPIEFRRYKVRNLMAIIKKHNLEGVDIHILWDEYRTLLEPHAPEVVHPYGLLFFGMLDVLERYQVKKRIYPEKMELAFDEQGKAGQLAIMFYSLLKARKKLPAENMISGTPRMLDDVAYIPLQAADMLAWAIRRSLDQDKSLQNWDWVYEEISGTICLNSKVDTKIMAELREIGEAMNKMLAAGESIE